LSAITEAVNAETSAVGKQRELVDLLHVAREAWSDQWPNGTEVQDQVLYRQKGIEEGILGRKGVGKTGKQTVMVEFSKELEIQGRHITSNSMAYLQFYSNFGGFSAYF
jgi:hypothetical protein